METRPLPLEPPKSVNAHCINQWFEACRNLPLDTRSAWKAVMHRYVQLCDSAGLLPFPDKLASRDSAIRNYLGQRRRFFVRYLDYTGLMADIKIRQVKRKVHIDHNGFSVNVEAWINVEDPYWFRQPKTKWRFSLGWDKEHRYTCRPDPGLLVYVRNPAIRSPNFWYFGFTINCPIEPDLTNGSLTEKEAYVLRQLWDPISKEFRAKGLNRVKHI